MRISEFHVEGFGPLANLSMTDVPPGLSIVTGENEAGKTTLLEFLRSILFGLPSRKQKEFYPPLKGGRKGGRIILLNEQSGRLIVERFEGKGNGPLAVTMPDGSQGGETHFRQLIGSATDDLYRNVFAFSLSELQSFESLNTEKVRDAIYSAGIGIGRRTITQVLHELTKQAGELFVPGGAAKSMNLLLRQIEDRGENIKGHEKDLDEYEQVQSNLAICESTLQRIGSDLNKARRRSERLLILKQAREDWVTLGACRQQMEKLPIIRSFPIDGVKRLDELNTERSGYRDQMTETTSQKECDEASLAAIKVDEILLSVAQEIRRLDRGLALYEQNRQQHFSTKTEWELTEQKLLGSVRDLGDEWDESKLGEFDLSIPVREEVETCRRAWEAASDTVRERCVQLEVTRQEEEDARRQEVEAQAQLARLGQPSAVIDADGIRKLQLGWERYDGARQDAPGIEKQCKTNVGHLLDTLRKIGPSWTEDRLNTFDTSLAVQEEVLAHQQRLTDLRANQQEADRRVRETGQAVGEAKSDLIRADEVLAAIPKSEVTEEAKLFERRRLLGALRSQLNVASEREARIAYLKERQQDFDAQVSQLRRELERESFSFPLWAILIVFVVGVVGTLALGMGRGDWVVGGIVFGLFVIVTAALSLARRAAVARSDRQRADWTHELDNLQQRKWDLEREAQQLQQELTSAQAVFVAQAQAAGCESIPDGLAIDDAEGRVERQIVLLRQRQPAQQRREDALRNLEKSEAAMSRATRTATDTSTLLDAAHVEWRQWLAKADLPASLPPENAANVLNRLDAAREQLKSIENDRERISQINEAIRKYDQQVKLVATASGYDTDIPGDVDAAVAFLIARLDEHEQHTRAADEAARRVAEVKNLIAQARRKVDKAQLAHQGALDLEQKAHGQWNDLLQRLGLRSSLTVEGAPQMFQAIERARDQLVQLLELRGQASASQQRIESYGQEVAAVSQTIGRPLNADADFSQAVAILAAELYQAEDDARRVDVLMGKIQECETRTKSLQRKFDQRQQEVEKLLIAAGTTEEEAFRHNAVTFENGRELDRQIRQLETRLLQVAGSEDVLKGVKQELLKATPESLNSESNELLETIERLEQQQTDAADERGQLKAELDRLQKSDELSRLRIAQQADRAEFESNAEEWSIVKVATYLIDRAREQYERERRPGVLKEAERYFAHFTNGKYTEILVPTSGDQVVVLTPDGARKEIGQLSRGTAEQLYLSLRFGFVREFVSRSESLPLVFDDILVNFDPGRARATAEAILDLSKSLQILFFTCHPATVELMKAVDGSIPVYALKDGRFTTDCS